MNTSNWDFFNYELPEDKIAKRPEWFYKTNSTRGNSKLLHFRRSMAGYEIIDRSFRSVVNLLHEGDLLVLNKTRVLNARFLFYLNEREYEVLLCKKLDLANCATEDEAVCWYALARPMKEFEFNQVFPISQSISATVLGKDETGRFLKIRLGKIDSANTESIDQLILLEGFVPIPPYIRQGKSDDFDREDYQTVFAKDLGSVAAPTAGLHFSQEILESLVKKGIDVRFLTLHVGPASFLPVNDPLNHQPMTEKYEMSSGLWSKVEIAKKEGRRVIAVGTTVIRALESFMLLDESVREYECMLETSLFIREGFEFKAVDACFTNFHQPRSSHLLLVAAFLGRENLEKVYSHALNSNYRFLSYGDSSFLEVR